MHLGGKHPFDFGFVRITPAFHGAGLPGGHACGFIIKFHGKTVYHSGDTALFNDMALLGRLEAIDVALVPIGDNYTMEPSDAAGSHTSASTQTGNPHALQYLAGDRPVAGRL